ncbi:hypothetical protein [Anaerovorax odorimutans]|nr:hypothetical protein [Anaerovorax odorimutans]
MFDLAGDGPMLLVDINYKEKQAIIPFPTARLSELLGSVDIEIPPERVYLGGNSVLQIRLLHNGTKEAAALAQLFQKHHSLDLVNRVSKAITGPDSRVSKQIKKHLKEGRYNKIEEILNEANHCIKAKNREPER